MAEEVVMKALLFSSLLLELLRRHGSQCLAHLIALCSAARRSRFDPLDGGGVFT
uniref:Uncharacterized protein n=1 Tax=Arundo donax TaxID=35708 RepID=A0A0A9F2G6_ARUDO